MAIPAEISRPIHSLKTWPDYWNAIKRGEKNFEVRKDDRGFQRGDTVELIYHDPKAPYSSRLPILARITYVLSGGQFGIEPGFVVFGLDFSEPRP